MVNPTFRNSAHRISGSLSRFALLCFSLVAGLVAQPASSALVPGDIAITRMNLDVSDGFSFVPLVAIDPGTEIHFTHFGWLGSVFNFGAAEAIVRWTAPAGGVAAGVVVNIDEAATANTFTTSVGSTVILTGYSLDASGDRWDMRTGGGDSLLAFTGTPAAPNFIAGAIMEDNWNAAYWNPATEWAWPNPPYSGSVNSSSLPVALTNGTTAVSIFPPSIPAGNGEVSIEKDNARYKAGVRDTGTRAELLAAINNYQNWENDDNTAYNAPAVTTFTVSPEGAVAPTLTATPTQSGVGQNGATLGGNITVTGGANATARGVVYALTSQNPNPEIGGGNVTVLSESGSFGTGAFTRNATSLFASTGYSYKAYATNSAGTSYSSVGTFTTLADTTPPTVVSVNRSNPSGQAITNGHVVFRVTYSEPVNLATPLVSHYAVMPVSGSNIAGTVTLVTPVSTSVYDVSVSITSGTGEFRLRVLD